MKRQTLRATLYKFWQQYLQDTFHFCLHTRTLAPLIPIFKQTLNMKYIAYVLFAEKQNFELHILEILRSRVTYVRLYEVRGLNVKLSQRMKDTYLTRIKHINFETHSLTKLYIVSTSFRLSHASTGN